MKVAAAQINPIVGDLKYNREKILAGIEEAKKKGCQLVVFPELALTGYPPEDLLLIPEFIESVEKELFEIVARSKGIAVILGVVRKNLSHGDKPLLNSAAIIQDGELIGYQDKTLLPDYDVFSERRYFAPATHTSVWSIFNKRVAITICEDIWGHAKVEEFNYLADPISDLKPFAPDVIVNISSSPYFVGRTAVRMNVARKCIETLQAPLLLCNQIGGNDGLIFDGYSFFLDTSGKLVALAGGFREDLLVVDLDAPFKEIKVDIDPFQDLFSALVMGVRDYFHKLKFKKALIGLSGGIDSALVACIAVEALGKENVLGLSMPSRYTSQESISLARDLAKSLGIELKEISIEEPFDTFLGTLSPHFGKEEHGLAEENIQSRIRAVLLMAFSNKFGHILLNTGNKSETAVGYTTLYGDSAGALAVLGDVTKTRVYALARWINREKEIIPWKCVNREPSAELRSGQRDRDTLPDYTLLDHIVEEYIEDHLSPHEIAMRNKVPLPFVQDLVKKIHLNEYKRRQMPPPLRVTKKAFTVGRRFPIVQHWNLFS